MVKNSHFYFHCILNSKLIEGQVTQHTHTYEPCHVKHLHSIYQHLSWYINHWHVLNLENKIHTRLPFIAEAVVGDAGSTWPVRPCNAGDRSGDLSFALHVPEERGEMRRALSENTSGIVVVQFIACPWLRLGVTKEHPREFSRCESDIFQFHRVSRHP